MLVDIALTDGAIQHLGTGLYLCQHWNFDYSIDEPVDSYPVLPDDYRCYGVCDSPEQLVAAMPFLESDDERYVVSFVKIERESEPASGGWRWRKWGPYIGDQTPQREYIADEPDIERVYTYHIYALE